MAGAAGDEDFFCAGARRFAGAAGGSVGDSKLLRVFFAIVTSWPTL
jgi:hypothetical protein